MDKPLADRLRPQSLDDVVGQRHLIGPDGILRRLIENGHIPNMIFYGPSGVGKTTLAGIIARQTNRKLYRLNATTASLSDIKAIVDELDTFLAPQGVLLYLDEIQYFNKKQQQSLLEFMENGKITLIASTTENPYFYVYNAILSRSTVFEFHPVTVEDVEQAVRRAFSLCARESHIKISLEEGVIGHIARACGGDVRKSINAVELLFSAAQEDEESESLFVSLEDARQVTQASAVKYGQGTGTATTTSFPRSTNPCGEVIPTPPSTISPDCFWQGISLQQPGGFWPAPARMWGLLIPRRRRSSRPVWIRLCSWGFRKPSCPWPRPLWSLPPPPNPTRSLRASPPPGAMPKRMPMIRRNTCGTPITRERKSWGTAQATASPMTTRFTMWPSNTFPIPSKTPTITPLAPTRWSSKRRPIGKR